VEPLDRGCDEGREQHRTEEGEHQDGRRRREDHLPHRPLRLRETLHGEPEGDDPHPPPRKGDRCGVFDETPPVAHHLLRPRVAERSHRKQGRNGTKRFSPLRHQVVSRHDVGRVPDGDEGDVGSLALVSETSRSSPSGSFRRRKCPRRGPPRGRPLRLAGAGRGAGWTGSPP